MCARSLFLLVKRKGEKLAGESDWSFPQGERKQGESMRDAVTRTLESFVGTDAQMSFVGYSPMGYIDRGEDDSRARVFFYKCQYISGQVSLQDAGAEDHMWATQEELVAHFDQELGQLSRSICDP